MAISSEDMMDEKEKKELLLSAMKRAVALSNGGARVLQGFRQKQAIALAEGKEIPPIPDQLLAPNLERLAATLAKDGMEPILAEEMRLQGKDAEITLQKAIADKARAEAILAKVESAVIKKESKEG